MSNNASVTQANKSIRIKAKRLKGEYRSVYYKTKSLLYADVQYGLDRATALSDFADMLIEASERKQSLSELFPFGYDAFYHELVGVLPVYSAESKQRKTKHKRVGYIATMALCLLLLGFIVLRSLGYIGIWTKGIAYPAGNLSDYSYSHTIDENEYSLIINLSDLESNAGELLYDDGKCSISTDKVDFVGIDGGGYRVQFRSHGTYSVDSARLVSGISHYSTEERFFSYTMTAKMTAEYNGKTYTCEIMGQSGLNYKDGDAFNFYIFPQQAYVDGEVSLSDAGNVTLTISNLCVNSWNRK